MRPFSAGARRLRPLLGTFVEIRLRSTAGHAERAIERAIERAFGAIERVHRAMSSQESTSDIARLRSGRCAALDPWTRRVLERAEEMRRATDGLFDCAACHYALDGIAKGFAVDRAVDCLQMAGIADGVVNAGGDLRIFGDCDEQIFVRPPHLGGALLDFGRIREGAIATSAGALVVDPRRATRRGRARGVTIVAADCTTADALTKPCLLEPQRAGELAARFGARAFVLDTCR